MKKILFIVSIILGNFNHSNSQSFLLTIESGLFLEDTCRIQATHIAKDSIYKQIIFDNILRTNSLNKITSLYVPYKKNEAIYFEFWINGKYKGGIQLFPSRLKARNKQYLSVFISNNLIYNHSCPK